MGIRQTAVLLVVAALLSGAAQPPSTLAQDDGPPPGFRPPGPQVDSPVVGEGRHVAFRILAPEAESVRLFSTDIPAVGWGVDMTKGTNGVWEATVGPVDPGAYRYAFNVDGVLVVDPRNPSASETNGSAWSLVCVPGSDFADTKDVPHGAVAEVTYYSESLARFRRMHVYTPPGYESGEGRFPVLYLLHGVFDSDDSWPTVGRAGFILDNLIAAGEAKPMVVVMPAGHTGPFRFGPPGGDAPGLGGDEFVRDFLNDLRPHLEKNYRLHTDRAHRAIAGLSMGGAQTLDIAMANLAEYAYIGVYSSGVFGIGGKGPFAAAGRMWEERHQEALDNAELKQGLDLVWFATGTEDFLLETSRSTVDMLRKHGFDVVYTETPGGHTWINWRQYLTDFAQLLFADTAGVGE